MNSREDPPGKPPNIDFFRLTKAAQDYANNATDLGFALSCFGSLIPYISDPVINVLDGLRDCTAVDLGNGPVPLSTCGGSIKIL